MRWLILVPLIFFAAGAIDVVPKQFCGFSYMDTLNIGDEPGTCFYMQVCVERRPLGSFGQPNAFDTEDYAARSGFVNLAAEAVAMSRANEITYQFLHRYFSEKSKLLETAAPEWSKHFVKGSYNIRIMKVSPGESLIGYDVLAKLCSK